MRLTPEEILSTELFICLFWKKNIFYNILPDTVQDTAFITNKYDDDLKCKNDLKYNYDQKYEDDLKYKYYLKNNDDLK